MSVVRPVALDQLYGAAAALGVDHGYWDVRGTWIEPGPETVLAVLAVLGAPVEVGSALRSEAAMAGAVAELAHHVDQLALEAVAPVVLGSAGRPLQVEVVVAGPGPSDRHLGVVVRREDGQVDRTDVRLGAAGPGSGLVVGAGRLDGRDWERRAVDLPGEPLGVGYHDLEVELDGRSHHATVLVAPDHVHQPDAADRLWGVFAPLYSLRVDRGWGPNVFDLDRLGAWLDGAGGKLVGTLPLLAGSGTDPSPYMPLSRRFWDETYLDVDRLPELADSPRARAWLAEPATVATATGLRGAALADGAAQARLVDRVLAELAPGFFAPGSATAPDFRGWVDDHPLVVDYARFRAVGQRRGVGWLDWPDALRDGQVGADDYDVAVAARHVYAQWSMDRQLGEVSSRLAGRGQRLYLDLPVGCAPDGFDTWIDRPAFGWGASVGAPPDDFFSAGQNWGFPPVRPAVARAEGHRLLAECVRHHMTHAGMLRLDHVMGLHRLFWVPDGMEATAGTYVRSRADEQFAVVAIESSRAGCLVVGEDLGTVPDEVREAMDRHRVLRSYVAEFSLHGAGQALARPDARMVATVDTHDTLPFAAFLADPHRRALLEEALRGAGWVEATDADQSELSDLRALLELLADSDAPALLVSLDDLVGRTEPQNVPGTGAERSNWVLRLPATVDQLATDPEIAAVLASVQSRRLASHLRHPGHPRSPDGTSAP